jgi:hypothetical protein
MQEAIAGHTGVKASIIRLGSLQAKAPIHQNLNSGLQVAAIWHM